MNDEIININQFVVKRLRDLIDEIEAGRTQVRAIEQNQKLIYDEYAPPEIRFVHNYATELKIVLRWDNKDGNP